MMPILEDENYCSLECPYFKQESNVSATCKQDLKPIIFQDGFRGHCIIQKNKKVKEC